MFITSPEDQPRSPNAYDRMRHLTSGAEDVAREVRPLPGVVDVIDLQARFPQAPCSEGAAARCRCPSMADGRLAEINEKRITQTACSRLGVRRWTDSRERSQHVVLPLRIEDQVD